MPSLIQKFTKEELEELKEYDKYLDKGGEDLYPLTAEQKKNARAMTQADRNKTTKTVYNFNKRERKVNDDKRYLVEILAKAFGEVAEVIVNNPEREIEFTFNDKKYKVVLSAPRK